jgi:hypothetical protein
MHDRQVVDRLEDRGQHAEEEAVEDADKLLDRLARGIVLLQLKRGPKVSPSKS